MIQANNALCITTFSNLLMHVFVLKLEICFSLVVISLAKRRADVE